MIEGIRRIQDMMERQSYVTDRAIATTTFLASELRKPVLIEGQDALEHWRGTRLAIGQVFMTRDEQPGDDTTRIGPEDVRRSGDHESVRCGAHEPTNTSRGPRGERSAACWSVETIAKVDSAPWFVLRPRGVNASYPPPVLVS